VIGGVASLRSPEIGSSNSSDQVMLPKFWLRRLGAISYCGFQIIAPMALLHSHGQKNRGDGMPYHIRAGSIRAIVADERRALELHRRLSGSDREEVSITDIFGGEIDAAKLEERASARKV
jgi:hypothetical protein